MRRFGFFLGVFSVGLVVFLVFTGQLGKLFDSKAGDPSNSSSSRDATNAPEMRLTFPDFQRKRDLFSFSGVVEAATSFNINVEWNSPWTLRDAKLDIYIYADDKAAEPHSIFALTSEIVHYRPKPQRILLERVSGKGEDGTSVATESLELTWKEDGEMRLFGTDPVQIGYPALQLHGERGFVGEIGSNTGLSQIEIQAPVTMAVNRREGSSLFGLNGAIASTDADPPSDPDSTRVFLCSNGPLVLTRKSPQPAQALFSGDVTIFESDRKELWPTPPAPSTRMECGALMLEFDPRTQQLHNAGTTSRDQRVRFVIGEEYWVEGDALSWSTGSGEARLAGDVTLRGAQGEFKANSARLLPQQNLCYLDDDIRARLYVAKVLGKGDNATGDGASNNEPDVGDPTEDPPQWSKQQLQTDVEFTADRAIVRYHASAPAAGETRRSRLQSFRAVADGSGQIRIRQLIPDDPSQLGAELLGTELTYDPQAQAVTIIGGENGASYPVFRQGQNEIRSKKIVLRRALHEVAFLDTVHCRLYKVPLAPGEEFREFILPSQPNRPYDIRSDQLRLRFDEKTRQVCELEITGDTQPYVFESVIDGASVAALPTASSQDSESTDRDFYRLEGEHLIWSRDWNPETETFEGEARLSGDRPQRLQAWGTELTAAKIYFDPTRWLARAEGDVRLRTSRAQLLQWEQRRDPSPAASKDKGRSDIPERDIEVIAQRLELQLGKVTREDKTTRENQSKGKELALLYARMWGSAELPVIASDGEFAIVSEEIEWLASEGTILLSGEGRQELRYGPSSDINSASTPATPESSITAGVGDMPNRISARTIRLDSNTRRAFLDGEVIGILHQASVSDPARLRETLRVEANEPLLPWEIRAGRVELAIDESLTRGDSAELRLQEVIGENNISISNDSLGLRFQGSAFRFLGDRQVLRLYSPRGQGPTQILTRTLESGEVDEILAREIRIGRVRNGDEHRLNILFDDRVNALFHEVRDNKSAPSPQRPENFQLNCQQLLMFIDASDSQGADTGAAKRLQEALAWGNVQFHAGNRNVFADRASYKRAVETLTFHSGDMKVQYNDGRASQSFDQLQLKIDRAGRYRVDIVGGEPWKKAQLEETLRVLKPEGDAEKASDGK